MSKAAKQYKPQQKEATEKHKKALAEYVQNIKDRCDTLMQGQMEAMRTGYGSLNSRGLKSLPLRFQVFKQK